MAPADGDKAFSIKGTAAAAAAGVAASTSTPTAASDGNTSVAAKPPAAAAAAKGKGTRAKVSLAFKPILQKTPVKASPPKALLDGAPLAANKDVKRASSAFATAVNDSEDSEDGTKPALARKPSSISRIDVKGKARASEEVPAVTDQDLVALEALKQGELPETVFEKPTPRSPSPKPAEAEDRHPEALPPSPRPRPRPRPRSRSPAGHRHPDAQPDAAVGLPYDGELQDSAAYGPGDTSSSRERPRSPPRDRRKDDSDLQSRRYRDEEKEDWRRRDEEERIIRAKQAEEARYGGSWRDHRPAFDTTPVAYRSGGYGSGHRYDSRYDRSGHSTQYRRPSDGYYNDSDMLDYGGGAEPSRNGGQSDSARARSRYHQDDYPRARDNYRGSDRDVRRPYNDRSASPRAHSRPEEDDPERPAKRPRRDSASSSRRDAQAHKSTRDRSTSISSTTGSEEGEIEEDERSILDDSSQQRVRDRLSQTDRHPRENIGPHNDHNRYERDRRGDRDRDHDRRPLPGPPAHLPLRPPPPHPTMPVPPRPPPVYSTPALRDGLPLPLPPRPLGGPTLPPPPLAMGAQPMMKSDSRDASRPPAPAAAPPPRPPPPPAAAPAPERPQAPYHPAVPTNTNVPVADVTPIESAAPSRAPTPAVSALAKPAPVSPPAVRTQRPHEELWLRSLELGEEIEGIFAGAASQQARPAAPPTHERKYVGCSHISEYTLQEKLGEGTFGVVWKGLRGGVNPATAASAEEEAQLLEKGLRVKRGDVVALKQIIFHNEGDGLPITSVREIRILKMLDHPNVVPVVDIAYEPADHANFKLGKTFMVFPYMDHDLAGLLENRSVRLETAHIKQYSKQLLEGTAYLHRNLILHRDMKAANLLINNQGQLMIADFGLARSIHKAEENAAYTSCVVTRWYRPPELLLGEKRYHTPVDMWGVACVMAEMYHRSPIFPGQSDFDQAVKIFAACGPPTAESMPGWEKLPGVEGHEKHMWHNNGRSIRADWSTRADELFGDLIDRILVLDPKKRLTAAEALDHDWFWTEPYPTDPARMPQYRASHEMDGRKRKEEQHAAFGAVPMQPFAPPPNMNGMRPNGPPIPAYGGGGGGGGAPLPMPVYNGGGGPPPPPVGAYNGPPPPMPIPMSMQHGYPPPPGQQQHTHMGGYGAGPPSGMAAGMGVGMAGYRPPQPPPPSHGANHNHSYAAAGPPIQTAGVGGMGMARRMGPSAVGGGGGGGHAYEGMRQGPSWQTPGSGLPPRPGGGGGGKINLMKAMLPKKP